MPGIKLQTGRITPVTAGVTVYSTPLDFSRGFYAGVTAAVHLQISGDDGVTGTSINVFYECGYTSGHAVSGTSSGVPAYGRNTAVALISSGSSRTGIDLNGVYLPSISSPLMPWIRLGVVSLKTQAATGTAGVSYAVAQQ